MTPPHELQNLRQLSARIGADPLIIQGAGGNTSVKDGDIMWIKASGTLLADALAKDIFVAVDLPAMRQSLIAGEERADQPAAFTLDEGALRPSIETSLHAVMPHRVVVHIHCVNTIAVAIRADATECLRERLAGFNWAFVSYAKPGAHLARQVLKASDEQTDVIVLGNHGLIVGADSVADVEMLLDRVTAALAVTARASSAPDTEALAALSDASYQPCAASHPLHAVALSGELLSKATQGSLYPDHVIFCGIAVTALGPGERPQQAVNRIVARGLPAPVFLLAKGKGALIRSDASAGAKAMARCLGDVLLRVPDEAKLIYLTDEQNAALLDWDAEKYRQALDAG